MSFFKNLWFQIRAKRTPRLTDSKTRKLIRKHNQADAKLVQFLSKKKVPGAKQIKYIGKVLSKREKFLIKGFAAIIVVAIAFIGVNSYLDFSSEVPAVGGKYTEGLIGAPEFINPVLAQTNDVDLDLTSLIFNGLLKYDPDQGLIPDLAESFSLSEDQKTYTFVLRDNIAWHDGKPLTADDVLFTFDRIKDTKTKSPLYFNFKGVSLEKIDDRTVRFILEEPFAPFVESLTTGILPAHIWIHTPAQNTNLSEFNIKPLGSGPFTFKSLIKDNVTGEIKEIVLERNENYFSEAAKIKELRFKFYPTFDLAIEALNNKNIQAMSFLPKEKQDQIVNDRSINFNLLNLPQYTALFFNKDSDNALLKDKTLRKIISYAIDKEKIIDDILNDQAQLIDGPVLPGQLGYTDDFDKYPFDIEHAKAELKKLDWTLEDYVVETTTEGGEGEEDVVTTETYPFKVRKKGDKYFEFNLTTVDQAENVAIADIIQKSLQQIGVKVNIKLSTAENIQREIIKPRDYDVLLYGQIIGLDPDPYAFWHSSQTTHPGLNLAGFANADVDDLLEEARKLTDTEKRAENYEKFQKKIAEEVPAIFLFNPTYTYPQTKKIQGFNNHTIILPANRFANINKWFIKTKRSFK